MLCTRRSVLSIALSAGAALAGGPGVSAATRAPGRPPGQVTAVAPVLCIQLAYGGKIEPPCHGSTFCVFRSSCRRSGLPRPHSRDARRSA